MKRNAFTSLALAFATAAIAVGCGKGASSNPPPISTGSAAAESIPAHCPVPMSPALIGLWESNETTKGGIGQALEFRGDGIYVGSLGVLVNMFYRISGDQLQSGLTTELRDLVATFRVEGDTLTRTFAGGEAIVERRFGSDRAEGVPLVGTWRYRHSTGPMAFERYTNDQRLLLRIPMRSMSACYAVSANNLTISPSAGEKTDLQFEIRGETLSLVKSGQPAHVYTRSPAVWYDIQHVDIGASAGQAGQAVQQKSIK